MIGPEKAVKLTRERNIKLDQFVAKREISSAMSLRPSFLVETEPLGSPLARFLVGVILDTPESGDTDFLACVWLRRASAIIIATTESCTITPSFAWPITSGAEGAASL
jgi:hypothetical protein